MTNTPVDLTDPAATPATPADPAGPFDRVVPWILTVGGAIGFLAAFVLTVERFKLLTDPAYKPSCSINSVLS